MPLKPLLSFRREVGRRRLFVLENLNEGLLKNYFWFCGKLMPPGDRLQRKVPKRLRREELR